MSTEMVQQFIRAGNAVFPCNEDKSPKWKWRDVSNHINHWDDGRLYAHPLYGWAIPAGLVVIDVDKPDLFPYMDICQGHAGQRTPRGNHYIFQDPGLDERAQVRFEWGEIRREGAYMCIYGPNDEWLRKDFEPLPAVFSVNETKQNANAQVSTGNGSGTTLTATEDHSKPIDTAPGGRNIELASYLGYWRRQGMNEAQLTALAMSWNAEQAAPLDDEEVHRTVASILRYEPDNRDWTPPDKNSRLNDRNDKKGTELDGLLSLTDLQAGNFAVPTFWHWCFGPGQRLLVHGKPGGMKSHWCLNMVFHMKRKTLILDGEMSLGILKHRVGTDNQGADWLFFAKPDPNVWLDWDYSDFEIIVIDTKFSLYHDKASENDAEHWAIISKFMTYWADQGKCVVLIHHSAKEGQARGSIAAEGMVDSMVKCFVTKQGMAAELTKNRHGIAETKIDYDILPDCTGPTLFLQPI